jgi:Outer mitochondrial membrane transport complex protein
VGPGCSPEQHCQGRLYRVSDGESKRVEASNLCSFTSHLTQTLSPLVDLSLYICAENYDTTTRAAYGATLPFPESWAVPPSRQKLAKSRTLHLGFDPADLYNPNPLPSSTRGSRSASSSPPTRAFDTPSPPQSVGGYFGKERNRSLGDYAVTSARLTALIEEALRPLATLQESNGHRYLLSDTPSTLDCHALALMALALLPSLSNPFLATGFAQFPGLERYTRATIREAFGPPVTASDALIRAPYLEDGMDDEDAAIDFESYENANIGSGEVKLPWRRSKRRVTSVAMGLVRAVAG